MTKTSSRQPPSTVTAAQHVSHTLAWSLVGAFLLLLLGAIGVGAITYERAYVDRIFPGVHIGTIDVGGQTRDEATARVRSVIDTRLNEGFTFSLEHEPIMLDAVVVAAEDPDLWYPLVEVNVAKHIDIAFSIGRSESLQRQWFERIRSSVNGGTTIPIDVTVHDDQLIDALRANYRAKLAPVRAPQLVPRAGTGSISWEVTPGQAGRSIDAAGVVAVVRNRVAMFDPAPIIVTTHDVPPPFTQEDVEAVLPTINAALARAPIQLTFEEQRWTIDAETLAAWIAIDDAAQPIFNRAATTPFLAPIATTLERPAHDARFTFNPTTKRVHEFIPSQDGRRIDRDALIAALEAAVFGIAPPLVAIPIVREEPTVALEDTNKLGIRELLGVGRTSFAGSPTNRRHNIGVGTSLLNGRIIAPDEVFSTVGAVSPFDDSNNYKQELVIKGNRTIPEFGGGLCQVSTTLFRAVLEAGLPVVERTNHAYRVSYYEPPVGKDATIYGPKPDFRFRNDTGHHLLLVTRVVGDEPIYEIWGTSDGRTAHSTEPEIFNYVQPPPTRIVKTADLPPGEKKCIERAHTGADARFTYAVTYPDGRVKETVFNSHYRPWQAVCLLGVTPEELSTDAAAPPDEPAATQVPDAPPPIE